MALETHVVFAYAYANMHSECNLGKFCYLHQQLAFRYVATVHGALCKYAHVPILCLKLQIYCLHLILQFASAMQTGDSHQLLCCELCAFVGTLCFVNKCFEALSLLVFNARLSLYKNMNSKVYPFHHEMLTATKKNKLCIHVCMRLHRSITHPAS